jgi:hypothetical protein
MGCAPARASLRVNSTVAASDHTRARASPMREVRGESEWTDRGGPAHLSEERAVAEFGRRDRLGHCLGWSLGGLSQTSVQLVNKKLALAKFKEETRWYIHRLRGLGFLQRARGLRLEQSITALEEASRALRVGLTREVPLPFRSSLGLAARLAPLEPALLLDCEDGDGGSSWNSNRVGGTALTDWDRRVEEKSGVCGVDGEVGLAGGLRGDDARLNSVSEAGLSRDGVVFGAEGSGGWGRLWRGGDGRRGGAEP